MRTNSKRSTRGNFCLDIDTVYGEVNFLQDRSEDSVEGCGFDSHPWPTFVCMNLFSGNVSGYPMYPTSVIVCVFKYVYQLARL